MEGLEDHGGISCQELVELLSDYLEGALAPPLDRSVRAHLAECPDCEIYLDQLRLAVRLTGRLREGDLPEPARDRLVTVFRDWPRD
jgi:predicted anti-sigma-YlaC factor YlaD